MKTHFYQKTNRREFIRVAGSGLASLYLTACSSSPLKKIGEQFVSASEQSLLKQMSPIQTVSGTDASFAFSGDQPDLPHSVLWRKKAFLDSIGGLPKPDRSVSVAVVGGGMSGLLSAYHLRDLNPVLLEQDPRFGGNSKGELWKGIPYTIGAGYISYPGEDSEVMRFWKEIGVFSKMRVWQGGDSGFHGQKYFADLWESGSDSIAQRQWKRLKARLQDCLEERHGHAIPEIPAPTPAARHIVNQLDYQSFAAWLEQAVGEPLHPEVYEAIEAYCWTAFAASSQELSAAAGLNFFGTDFEGRAVLPGGNSAIAEAVLKKLLATLDPKHLLPGCLVFDVRTTPQGVQISYLDPQRQPKSVLAQKAILSCPKFVVAHLIDTLEPERLEAIRALKYRAYLVANAWIDQPLRDDFYDLYLLSGAKKGTLGRQDPQEVREWACRQKATDLFHGTYAQPDSQHTVLTLCRAMPYDEGRSEVYHPKAFEQYQAEFRQQLEDSVLPLLKIPRERLVGLRITRWGHPLPVPQTGFFASGKVDVIRKPFGDRVFFVEQDNWAQPCFETAFFEAKEWAAKVRG